MKSRDAFCQMIHPTRMPYFNGFLNQTPNRFWNNNENPDSPETENPDSDFSQSKSAFGHTQQEEEYSGTEEPFNPDEPESQTEMETEVESDTPWESSADIPEPSQNTVFSHPRKTHPPLKRLKALRLQKGYTQQTLAAQLQISPQFYSCLERGLNTLSVRHALTLSKIFKKKVEDLFGEDLGMDSEHA